MSAFAHFRGRVIALLALVCALLGLVACSIASATVGPNIWRVGNVETPECATLDTSTAIASTIVTSWESHQIFRIHPNGDTEVIAGTGHEGFDGDEPADPKKVRLRNPVGCAFNSKGELIFADSGNHRIRKLSADGKTLTTIAGAGRRISKGGLTPGLDSGSPSSMGFELERKTSASEGLDEGPEEDHEESEATAESGLSNPTSFTDALRHLHTLRGKYDVEDPPKDDPETFAGDGDSALNSRLHIPRGIAITADDEIVFADAANNRVRKFREGGKIETVIGPTFLVNGKRTHFKFIHGISLSPDGRILIADLHGFRIYEFDRGTMRMRVNVDSLEGAFKGRSVAFSPKPSMFFFGDELGRIAKLDSETGSPVIISGHLPPEPNDSERFKAWLAHAGDGDHASKASLANVVGLKYEPAAGGLLVSDYHAFRVRFIGDEADEVVDQMFKAALQARKDGREEELKKITRALEEIKLGAKNRDVGSLKKISATAEGSWILKTPAAELFKDSVWSRPLPDRANRLLSALAWRTAVLENHLGN